MAHTTASNLTLTIARRLRFDMGAPDHRERVADMIAAVLELRADAIEIVDGKVVDPAGAATVIGALASYQTALRRMLRVPASGKAARA